MGHYFLDIQYMYMNIHIVLRSHFLQYILYANLSGISCCCLPLVQLLKWEVAKVRPSHLIQRVSLLPAYMIFGGFMVRDKIIKLLWKRFNTIYEKKKYFHCIRLLRCISFIYKYIHIYIYNIHSDTYILAFLHLMRINEVHFSTLSLSNWPWTRSTTKE